LRGTGADRIWERGQGRFAGSILGSHFERLCREWTLYNAGDRFGDWPVQVASGTVNDPANKTTCQVDVAVLGHADGGRPPLLAIGEAKWNEVMGLGHLERLHRIRELLAGNGKFDTSATRLACFSGAGFTADLRERAVRGEVELIGLDDLYTAAD
jgi:uncharacterized protein